MSDQPFQQPNIRPLGEENLNILKKGDKLLLWGALGIAIITFAFAAVAVDNKQPIVRDFGEVLEQRQIIIQATGRHNHWDLIDAETGELIKSYGRGTNDFLKGQLPGIEWNRKMVNADFSKPYTLTRYDSRALVWEDPETGKQMLLHRMGPAPRQSVGQLLASRSSESQAQVEGSASE